MKKADYKRLLESVRQGGSILRGEVEPARTFEYRTPERDGKLETRLAICVKTDDPALLIVNKIYAIGILEDDLV